jgi:hypothetical protein
MYCWIRLQTFCRSVLPPSSRSKGRFSKQGSCSVPYSHIVFLPCLNVLHFDRGETVAFIRNLARYNSSIHASKSGDLSLCQCPCTGALLYSPGLRGRHRSTEYSNPNSAPSISYTARHVVGGHSELCFSGITEGRLHLRLLIYINLFICHTIEIHIDQNKRNELMT